MKKIVLLCALAVVASPVAAKERDKSKTSDPNRMICRTEQVIGSRLQSKRTCLTAMQWDQMEREQRETVDRVQAFKPQIGG
ncbi:hypothetical protein M0208_07930 [Sphingomonas sp. SUN019]|uniref:hypothetical protein n=1 Tax=Sphingomonas sp. SUN019 TaxID=2937788 RepID=UPI002164895C|nr:hypothetical protein [Sphingomonas sp. SUN019]UVO50448.1 hypothetical protein M0208_07930 [Sphingomonas sp. SUN019]